MKHLTRLAIVLAITTCAGSSYVVSGFLIAVASAKAVSRTVEAAQSGNDLFQQALSKERAEGRLDEAIRLYERIAKEFAGDRPLAAKALIQMGRCYERLGKTEAKNAYDRVLREYADQRALADEARARLAALAKTGSGPTGDPVARRVWAGPELMTFAAPSPDGRLLSFEDADTGDLAIRDLTTGRTRRLTSTQGSWNEWAESSVFSPDGKHIAYGWLVFKPGFAYELRTIGIAGGKATILYSNADVEGIGPAAWTPDGKAILAQLRRRDRTHQIALISTVDGSVRVLKTLDWRKPAGMTLSPDGRWIAYDFPTSPDAAARDIFVLDVSGSRETVLVKHPANDLSPVWTPDGSGIVFTSDRAGTMGAWFMQMRDGRATGEPRLVKSDLGPNVPLGFAGHGAYFYAVQTGGGDVSIVPIDPETGTPAGAARVISERFVGTNSGPAWSPDGTALAYVSARGVTGQVQVVGGRALVIHSLADGRQRDLFVKSSYFRSLRWRPDGRSLLFIGRDEKGREGLYTVEIQSGNVTPIVQSDPGLYVNWAEWIAGGRDVVYSAPTGAGGGHLVKRNVETGAEQVLHQGREVVGSLAVSPDGQHVVFHAGAQLKLVAIAGGSPRDLLPKPDEGRIPGFRGLTWTRNGRYVLFPHSRGPEAKDQRFELWRVAVDSGVVEPVGLTMDALSDATVDPEGRRLVFAGGALKFEIWAVQNLVPLVARPALDR